MPYETISQYEVIKTERCVFKVAVITLNKPLQKRNLLHTAPPLCLLTDVQVLPNS